MEKVELTTKEKILIAIHEESKKDNPDMEANITAEKFDITYNDFKRILYEISELDSYVENILVGGKYPDHLVIKNIVNMRLSSRGLSYVQDINKPLNIEHLIKMIDLVEELTNEEKIKLKETIKLISNNSNNDNSKNQVLELEKYLCKIKGSVGNKMQELIVEIASETIIKAMKEIGMLPR